MLNDRDRDFLLKTAALEGSLCLSVRAEAVRLLEKEIEEIREGCADPAAKVRIREIHPLRAEVVFGKCAAPLAKSPAKEKS